MMSVMIVSSKDTRTYCILYGSVKLGELLDSVILSVVVGDQ